MPVERRAVEREVARCPLEIRVRQIDAGRRLAGRRRVDAECAGVREQVEQRAPRLGRGARTRDAMIEEQARVDVVTEVDSNAAAFFGDGAHGAGVGEALVLMPFATSDEPRAPLDEDVIGRRAGRRRRCCRRGLEPCIAAAALALGVDVAVVADHERAFVGVDGDRHFRNVAIVEAIAADALALRPLAEVARVLRHAIAQHVGDRRRRHRARYTPATLR